MGARSVEEKSVFCIVMVVVIVAGRGGGGTAKPEGRLGGSALGFELVPSYRTLPAMCALPVLSPLFVRLSEARS